MNGSLEQIIAKAKRQQFNEGTRTALWSGYRMQVFKACRNQWERDEALRKLSEIFDTDLRIGGETVEWATN